MEKQEDDKFTFTWIIENFSMCHKSAGQYFDSPIFALNSLPGNKWCVRLYPKSVGDETSIAVCLKKADDVPETCSVKYSIHVTNCIGESASNFKLWKQNEVCLFKDKRRYYSAQREPVLTCIMKGILIIKCILKSVRGISEPDALPPLSSDNGLFTDVSLRASDQDFKVHKAILWARWPKLAERLEKEAIFEQNFDIEPDILDAIIKYVYNGKLDFNSSEFLGKVYSAAAKYELSNLSPLPTSEMRCRTRINAENISFDWPIDNFHSLPVNTVIHSHVFTVNILKSGKWNLIFRLHDDDLHGRIFDISICRVSGNEFKPIFVRSTISFSEKNSTKNEHLFQMDEIWKCSEFSRSLCSNVENILLLKCEFEFVGHEYFSEIVGSSSAFLSPINCHYFKTDLQHLYESGTLSDVNIIVGSRTFPAHRCILCARSSVFNRMFETEMTESKTKDVEISDVDPDIMNEFLMFLYTGCLSKPLDDRAEKLYAVADKYDVLALRKTCSSFLQSSLSVKNLYRSLMLADRHCDDELYKKVVDFFSAHAKEVFSTDEWSKFTKENLWVKFLRDVMVHKKS